MTKNKKISWPFMFCVLALFRFLSSIPFIIDDDEAWWVVAARALSNPGEYYLRAVDHKPPGIVWFYWFAEKILHCGTDPRFIRAFYSALVILMSVILGWMA